MTELIKIDHKEFGLQDTKAKEIKSMFLPMLNKMEELETDFNNIVNKEMSKELCSEAKELRLKYVKVRTGTAAIHKDLKAFYLQGGRFVDGLKNAQLMASQGKEDKLKEIEDYYENIEKERIAKLQIERENEIRKYEVEILPENLGKMDEQVWNNFLTGTIANYNAKKEAEAKAEADRLAQMKAEKEEQERIRKENEKLKAEAEARAKAEAKKQAEYDAQIKAEREAKAKLEAELKAKAEAEAEAQRLKEEQLQAELSKGDVEKIEDLKNDLIGLQSKYQFKSNSNKEKYERIADLLNQAVAIIGEV